MILERHPELRRLSPADKLALVSELWDDLAAHPEDVSVIQEWAAEAVRRRDEVRSGKVLPISGEEVIAEVRRIVGR